MASSLDKQSWLAQAEAHQRQVTRAVAEGKMQAPKKRALGRPKDSDFHKERAQQFVEPKRSPGEKHWSDMHHFSQIKHARDIHGGEDAVDVIQTANDARRFLAKHYGEEHLIAEVCTDVD